MKYLAPARRAACVLVLILGAFGVVRISADKLSGTAIAAEYARVHAVNQSFFAADEPVIIAPWESSALEPSSESTLAPATSAAVSTAAVTTAAAAAQSPFGAEKPTVVALAEPVSSALTREPRATIALPHASSQWSAPASFFTINQVLAKQHEVKSRGVHLAAIDPKTITDAAPAQIAPAARSDEPFNLFTFRAPEGQVWIKWRGVEAAIQAEAPALARCRANPASCTPAAARFVAIIKQAEASKGRAKLEVVNERVNAAIHYMTDMAQWGVADLWSAPLGTDGKGSFDTGFGDCEDYAIAKYVALREAGLSATDLRLLLVRDNAVHLDHAVLAARQDGGWLVLDNRWSKLIEDTKIRQFMPLFALNDEGVKLFAAPYAAQQKANTHTADSINQDFSAGSTRP